MTYFKELPVCRCRFGRTEIVEVVKGGIEKKIARMIMACGFREVDPEECILCQGFQNVKLELKIHTFIIMKKGYLSERI